MFSMRTIFRATAVGLAAVGTATSSQAQDISAMLESAQQPSAITFNGTPLWPTNKFLA